MNLNYFKFSVFVSRLGTAWALSTVVLALASCQTNKTSNGTATIGPEGGAVELQGGPSLQIPAGALWSVTTLTISQSAAQAPITAQSPLFQFGPEGTSFKLPVTVSFNLAATTSASVYWSALGSANEYEALSTTVDGAVATARVTHLSSGFLAGRCVDDAVCGADKQCPSGAGSNASCIKGAPACCAGTCVDLKADDKNCGHCNLVCLPNESCSTGVCVCTGTECNLVCVDDKQDPNNCGGCGNACPPNVPCCGGSCCPPTASNACCWGPVIDQTNGTCTNLATDAHNCGRCGGDCIAQYGDGASCENGTCRCPPGQTAGDGSCTCGQGKTKCQDTCADLLVDPQNCGLCGSACVGGQTCVSGFCQCPGTQILCGGSCIDRLTDPQNCGFCGNVCSQGQSCVQGACEAPCAYGQTRCGPTCVNLQSDANNCGSCDHACPVYNNNAQSYGPPAFIQKGLCCGGSCIDWTSDLNNCGSCGRSCGDPAVMSCCNGGCFQGDPTTSQVWCCGASHEVCSDGSYQTCGIWNGDTCLQWITGTQVHPCCSGVCVSGFTCL